MKPNQFTYLFYAIAIILILFLFIATLENAFFWDTVQLGSLHANFYYENNFSEFLLPKRIDSGHIPAFGMYIAFAWKVFGRTLLVSHLAMLPFILGMFWQIHKLVSYFFKDHHKGIVFLLLLIDTVLLGQITLVSPDVPLLMFFFMAFNFILTDKKKLLSLTIIFLFLTSMRGMMISFCLLFIDIWLNAELTKKYKQSFLNLVKRSLIYLPALFVFIGFSYWHYTSKGWIGYHDDSPWAASFKAVGFNGFAKNIGVYIWRLLDFGKIAPVIVALILGSMYLKKYWSLFKGRILILALLIFVLLFPINMMWATGLLAHRYLLPVTMLFSLSAAYFLMNSSLSLVLKRGIIMVWITVTLSGHFWIYPDKIAQGWDSSLAHLPYYNLQKEAIRYFDDNQIELEQVETFFPSQGAIDFFFLNGDQRIIDGYEGKRNYVIYSNINNLSDEEYDYIHSSAYTLIETLESNRVFIKIFKKVLE
jgi:hypothetical protein